MKSIFICFVLLSTGVSAQHNFEFYTKKYPKSTGVFLERERSVNIDVDNSGKLLIEENTSNERLFLNDNFKYYIEGSIGYSSFSEISDVEPIVYLPDGDKYKKIKIKEIEDEDSFDESVFHDDIKQKTFFYDGLTKGGKTSLSYSKKYLDPYHFGTFFFSSYLPVESAIYEVKTPADMEIAYKLFGDDTNRVVYSVESNSKYKIHRWKAIDMPELNYQKGELNLSYFATHLQIYIKNYTYKGEEQHLIRNVEDLYAYYWKFVDGVNDDAGELKKTAENLTVGLETIEEKVAAIFYWVQDNIKYVAFEDGLGGFIPRKATLVCDRKYGDCKDMTSVLYTMINSIGVPAHYTWIGSRDIPYAYDDVPTPATDDHMICAYHNGNEFVFLDATGKGYPLGMPTPFIQGKQALIGINKDEYELQYVPIMEAEQSTTIDSVTIEIKDDIVSGTGKVTYNGYSAVHLSDLLLNISDNEKKDFYQESFKKGNNKCNSNVIGESGVENRGGPLVMDYVFDIPDYLNKYGDEIYVNPFLKKYFSDLQYNPETNFNDRDFRYREIVQNVVTIKIPEGYEVSYLPKSVSLGDNKFSADITFEINDIDQTIDISTRFVINTIVIESEYFDTWNKTIKDLNTTYSEVITFKEK